MSRKRPRKRKWHICDDCIDPVADGLQKIVQRWNVFFNFERWDELQAEYELIAKIEMFGGELDDAQRERLDETARAVRSMKHPPQPRDIEDLYRDFGILDKVGANKPAVNWLRFNVSKELAEDFALRLFGPLRLFHQLYFRACQILDGDEEGLSTEVLWRRHAIRRARAMRYAIWESAGITRDEIDDPISNELEDGHAKVEHALRAAVGYLRDVSHLLREKIEQADSQQKAAMSQAEVRRPGRPGKQKLYRRLRELHREHGLKNEWAKLARLANEDERAVELNGGAPISRDVARTAICGSRKRRGEKPA